MSNTDNSGLTATNSCNSSTTTPRITLSAPEIMAELYGRDAENFLPKSDNKYWKKLLQSRDALAITGLTSELEVINQGIEKLLAQKESSRTPEYRLAIIQDLNAFFARRYDLQKALNATETNGEYRIFQDTPISPRTKVGYMERLASGI